MCFGSNLHDEMFKKYVNNLCAIKDISHIPQDVINEVKSNYDENVSIKENAQKISKKFKEKRSHLQYLDELNQIIHNISGKSTIKLNENEINEINLLFCKINHEAVKKFRDKNKNICLGYNFILRRILNMMNISNDLADFPNQNKFNNQMLIWQDICEILSWNNKEIIIN